MNFHQTRLNSAKDKLKNWTVLYLEIHNPFGKRKEKFIIEKKLKTVIKFLF